MSELSHGDVRRAHELVDLLRVGVCVLDKEKNVRLWNRGAEDISGYTAEEVLGEDAVWRWLYPEGDYRSEIMARANAIITNKLYEENLETTIRRKDGETRIVSWNLRATYDENNRMTGVVAVCRDITEEMRVRKELERRSKHLEDLAEERTRSLRDNEGRLYAIIQGSPEGIVVADLNCNIVECNKVALQLFNSPSMDRLIGRNVLDFVSKTDHDFVSTAFKEMAKSETVRDLRCTMLRSEGEEYAAEVSASIVKDAAGSPTVYVTIIRDLTEQNEIQARLRKAERMAVIGETAAMVGHDLRNPLQGISGAVYVLRQKFGSTADSETEEMLGLIETSLDYTSNIVKELMDYSSEVKLELKQTTAKAVTEAALLQVNIPGNVTVRNLTHEKPGLLVDAAKTQRVFVNLIGNAVDAMPTGGELTIASVEGKGVLEIRFSDTGRGMSDDAMRNLWKPFKTTKSKGMGLGLAICKRIVEAHGGTVTVETSPGTGTTFKITFPINRSHGPLAKAR